MAHLTRSAKSGGEWMLDDLDSYKISLKEVDPYLFFGLQVGEDNLRKDFTVITRVTGVATTLS
jgi:hypothetical protein